MLLTESHVRGRVDGSGGAAAEPRCCKCDSARAQSIPRVEDDASPQDAVCTEGVYLVDTRLVLDYMYLK